MDRKESNKPPQGGAGGGRRASTGSGSQSSFSFDLFGNPNENRGQSDGAASEVSRGRVTEANGSSGSRGRFGEGSRGRNIEGGRVRGIEADRGRNMERVRDGNGESAQARGIERVGNSSRSGRDRSFENDWSSEDGRSRAIESNRRRAGEGIEGDEGNTRQYFDRNRGWNWGEEVRNIDNGQASGIEGDRDGINNAERGREGNKRRDSENGQASGIERSRGWSEEVRSIEGGEARDIEGAMRRNSDIAQGSGNEGNRGRNEGSIEGRDINGYRRWNWGEEVRNIGDGQAWDLESNMNRSIVGDRDWNIEERQSGASEGANPPISCASGRGREYEADKRRNNEDGRSRNNESVVSQNRESGHGREENRGTSFEGDRTGGIAGAAGSIGRNHDGVGRGRGIYGCPCSSTEGCGGNDVVYAYKMRKIGEGGRGRGSEANTGVILTRFIRLYEVYIDGIEADTGRRVRLRGRYIGGNRGRSSRGRNGRNVEGNGGAMNRSIQGNERRTVDDEASNSRAYEGTEGNITDDDKRRAYEGMRRRGGFAEGGAIRGCRFPEREGRGRRGRFSERDSARNYDCDEDRVYEAGGSGDRATESEEGWARRGSFVDGDRGRSNIRRSYEGHDGREQSSRSIEGNRGMIYEGGGENASIDVCSSSRVIKRDESRTTDDDKNMAYERNQARCLRGRYTEGNGDRESRDRASKGEDDKGHSSRTIENDQIAHLEGGQGIGRRIRLAENERGRGRAYISDEDRCRRDRLAESDRGRDRAYIGDEDRDHINRFADSDRGRGRAYISDEDRGRSDRFAENDRGRGRAYISDEDRGRIDRFVENDRGRGRVCGGNEYRTNEDMSINSRADECNRVQGDGVRGHRSRFDDTDTNSGRAYEGNEGRTTDDDKCKDYERVGDRGHRGRFTETERARVNRGRTYEEAIGWGHRGRLIDVDRGRGSRSRAYEGRECRIYENMGNNSRANEANGRRDNFVECDNGRRSRGRAHDGDAGGTTDDDNCWAYECYAFRDHSGRIIEGDRVRGSRDRAYERNEDRGRGRSNGSSALNRDRDMAYEEIEIRIIHGDRDRANEGNEDTGSTSRGNADNAARSNRGNERGRFVRGDRSRGSTSRDIVDGTRRRRGNAIGYRLRSRGGRGVPRDLDEAIASRSRFLDRARRSSRNIFIADNDNAAIERRRNFLVSVLHIPAIENSDSDRSSETSSEGNIYRRGNESNGSSPSHRKKRTDSNSGRGI